MDVPMPSRAHWHRWRGVLAGAVSVLGLLAPAAPAAAAPGDLDPAFSRDGKQTTDFGRNDQAHAVALQGDRRIVVAGTTATGAGGPWDPSDLALARYRADGSLDRIFSGDGKVTHDVMPLDVAHAVAVQPDGRIVVAGEFTVPPGTPRPSAVSLVRFNSDGSLDDGSERDATPDDAFGVGGIARLDGVAGGAIALQANGQIVLAGGHVLARFNHDGWPDLSFGVSGKVDTYPVWGSAVVLQADGRIVTAGYVLHSMQPQLPFDFGLARYTYTGTLDVSFAAGGRAITDFGATDFARGVAVQQDGKIVAAGETGPTPPIGPFANALARYNPDGSLDDGSPSDTTTGDSFGDGKVTTDGMRGWALALEPGGRIVTAGVATPGVSGFALARYGVTGSLDARFAGNGIQRTGLPFEQARGVVLQPDGNIVAAGFSEGDFAVARYLGDGPSAVTSAVAATARALRRAGIPGVLRRSGAGVSFTAPAAGVVRGRATAAKVTVLAGARTFAAAGKARIKLRLTRQGRRILERARRTRLTVRLAFVDAGGGRAAASRTAKLRR